MDNDIIKLLGIKEAGIKYLGSNETQTSIEIYLEKELCFHYCPVCGCRMYSKGIYERRVNHPVLQNDKHLIIHLKQRRWKCSNPTCKATETDQFSFVDKRRRNTNLTDLLIVRAFKDPNASASAIAKRFGVSDTHAITTFSRYVDMPRRQLTEAICIDEVCLDISKQYKYAMVIQDFATGEPLDMVVSRKEKVTLPYFADIPIKERNRVKYLVSDMYAPYQEYVDKYFPHAIPVVDAFHVIKLINNQFLQYIRFVLRKIDDDDRIRHGNLEEKLHREIKFFHSRDYYVLKKYNWMLLKNKKDLKYYTQPRMDYKLGRTMTTHDYLKWLFSLDSSFEERRNLKELYVEFNDKYAGNPDAARPALRQIIALYKSSRFKMFNEVAYTLEKYFDAIINSFIICKRLGKDGEYQSRLSNGPMESLNRIPKDMKRVGRGYLNFQHIRNRFLYSQRKNATILGSPKTLAQVYLEQPKHKLPYKDPYLCDVGEEYPILDEE